MRFCPTCQTEYPDGVEICARDGRTLVSLSGSSDTGSELGDAAPSFASPAASSVGPSVGAEARPADPTTPTPAGPVAASLSGAAAEAVPAVASSVASSEIFDSLVGATLAGRYQIIRRIGEGGMGAVYEAKHTIIGKRVAVKVLLEKFLAKSDFVARLLQEARLASAIGHEHIVDVTDFGTTDDGRAFVAMEFLDGESLAELVMREAPLPVERSLRITRQVASALCAAHAKGIVHRDVKPENVYLIKRGDADFVKVVDFGISKAVKQGQGDDAPDYRLTHTGLLLGTPLYMSPEQARGDEDLDHRVDVWAMGVMLYECLTGEVPFRANNYLGIISQVLTHTALPPSKLRPELGIPEAVESVVMHAMEKDRNRRYALMSEVERDLDRLLAGDHNVGPGAAMGPATVPPLRGPARGRIWVWSAAVAALVGGVAMVLARPEASPDQPASGGSVVQRPSEAASANPGGQVPGAASPASAATAPLALPGPSSAGLPAGASHPAPDAASQGQAPAANADHRGAVPSPSPSSSPSRRATRPGNRVAHERLEGNRGAAPRGTAPDKKNPRAVDTAIRGAVPSTSGEGYPKN